MYMDRESAVDHAYQIQAMLDWFYAKYRKALGKAPDRKLVFVDTETTGLKPGKDKAEIIEVAVIVEEPNGLVRHWATKIKPQHIETAHPKALEVNGYTPEKWVYAVEPKIAAQQLMFLLKDATLVGHSVAFDVRFLDHLFEVCGFSFRVSELPSIDTKKLADQHLKSNGLKSASLVSCCDFFGWDRTKAHTAEADTENCRRLYHKLKSPSDSDLTAWATKLRR